LSLCVSVITNTEVRTNLVNAAELSYSRVSLITQFFYQQLLEQLLHFQTTRFQPTRKLAPQPNIAEISLRLKTPDYIDEAFAHPAILENTLPFTPVTTRLDYGENCLATPSDLKKAIAEAFARQEITPDETQVHQPLAKLLRQRYGIEFSDRRNFAFGSGVSAIFSSLIRQCSQQAGTFLFPQGAYGYFRASFAFHDVPVKIVKGEEKTGFKLSLDALEKVLASTENPWLYLNAPISNPTGALYSASELEALVKLAWQYKATVVLDTIFAGLEFAEIQTKFDLSWIQERRQRSTGKIILLGGMAKEFAAAGMRFGYAYAPDSRLIKHLSEFMACSLPQTTRYAIARFFQSMTSGDKQIQPNSNSVWQHQRSQCQILATRAAQLTQILSESGWQVLSPQGGLFLVAKPVAFLGKTISYDLAGVEHRSTIDGDSITQALFAKVGLTINGATWTGLPDYCRFVLSVSESDFEVAISKIRKFYSLIQD
ncbi:MAG: aminotransferase class I/II-fold pyridoxal phosphate-dependent enzyme, partial [Cyanobacteria bacterium J06642_3]